jgi:lysophospholipase L1-like esterase
MTVVAGLFASPTAKAAPSSVRPIKIVIIGDSYSAGNGAGSYTGPSGCYRSDNNWAARYARWLTTQGHPVTLVNRACSGGVTDDFRAARSRDVSPVLQGGTRCVQQSPDQRLTKTATVPGLRPGTFTTICQAELRPQIDALEEDTDLVVFTFGGNDINFEKIVEHCFVVGTRHADTCRGSVKSAEDLLPTVENRLVSILTDIRGKLRKDAKIVLLGYPQLVGDGYGYVLKSHDLLHRVTDSYDAKTKVRELGVAGLNAQKAAVERVKAEDPFVTYVDQVQTKFAGREPGPRPSHSNPSRWLHEAFDTRIPKEWYHPNDSGHWAYTELLQGLGDLGASHPAATAGSLDLVFAIDTTGSMAGTIDSVRRRVETIADRLAAGTSSYRMAVVSFRDHPEHTGSSIDYPSRVDQDFTSNAAAVKAAVGTLEADGGGDAPESAYSGITAALNLDWRPGVKKHLIVFTDVDAHDPEPVTGLTADDVVAHAAAVDPAVINVVDTGGGSNLATVASRTGGVAVQAASDTDVDTAIDSIITNSLQAPYAWVGEQYLATVGTPVQFDASGSFDPAGGSLRYEWDVDNNGTADATTDAPELSWTYTSPYSGLLSVRVVSSGGLSSFATAPVVADADGDGIADEADNCPTVANLDQEDYDSDKTGDTCDDTPGMPTTDKPDVTVEETLNSQPSTTADEFSGNANQPLAVPAPGVLGNDFDPDPGDALQAKLAAPPTHGSVTVQADGSFTYTPNSGYAGDDSFKYVAEDGKGGSSAATTVTIHIASAPSVTQRLTFVAGGKHPLTVSGRVVEGSFDIVSNTRRISSVSGTATVKDRKGRTWVVTIKAARSRHGYTAKINITGNGHWSKSWSGSGILAKRGRNTLGAFRDHHTPFGFVIQTRT